MRRRRHRAAAESGGANWLTTFNDLVTLLMVFFVLVFSMSSIDTGKMKGFQASLQAGLGMLEAGKGGTTGVFDNGLQPAGDSGEAEDADKASGSAPNPVQRGVQALDALDGVAVTQEPGALRIRMEGGVLFAFGSAGIDPRGERLLKRVARIVEPLNRPLRVEGHTDDVPIHTAAFPSNWELSTARAVNVVKYLIAEGGVSPHRLSAVGYGDAKPLEDNETPEGRAQNRRVEIVLELTEETTHV